MSSKLQSLRGMKDLMPSEFCRHDYIKRISKTISELYGYLEISTPILEYTEIFDRTLGDTSDVVSKEIYSFLDRKGRNIALRPEFTAGIMRAVMSNGIYNKLPFKAFSYGPVFRYDRPQDGRQRQFHQLNFEHIGAEGPYCDAEIIKLAVHILDKLGIFNDITLEINSLGCTKSRTNYQKALIKYFSSQYKYLSSDSQRRLKTNPLRILDSKDKNDKLILQNSPLIVDYYTDEAYDYFEQVRKYLEILGIRFILNPKLVRGLDYYSHIVFEFTTTKLVAQATVLAGGRYDGLSEIMGGPKIPAIGFAAGVERIAMMAKFKTGIIKPVFIIPIGSECEVYAINLSNSMREKGICAVLDLNDRITKRIQRAIVFLARFVVFIGLVEMSKSRYKLKDLASSEEKLVDLEELLYILS